jgi:hypothetical protein
MYDGFFFEPGVRVFGGQSTDINSGSMFYGPQTMLGWHWIWDSGFNIALAAGAGYTWAKPLSGNTDGVSFDGVLPAGYLRLGKTF